MKAIQLLMMNKKLATGWDLSTASYDSISFYVGSQEVAPRDLFFKPDGTKMYMMGYNARVYQYTISTAWDVSTASYDSISFSVGSQGAAPYSLFFKPDGTKMYVVGHNLNAYQYTLSTPWEMNTASYDSISFYVRSQDREPYSLFFKPDGTKMYMMGGGSKGVYQYTLSTPWEINTASYKNISFSVGSQDEYTHGLFFKPDGTKMYMMGGGSKRVYQYTLSTPWDVSTASYDSISFYVGSQEVYPSNFFFKPDGTKMYVVGSDLKNVHQYSLT